MFFKRCIAAILVMAMSTFYPFSYVQAGANAIQETKERLSQGHIAQVLFVKGEVYAEDSEGKHFSLKSRSKIFKGDSIVTKNTSLIQINFLDGSMLRLTGNGRMNLDQYQQNSKGLAEANVNIEEGDFAIMVKKVSKLEGHHNYSVTTKKAKVSLEGTFGQGSVQKGGELDFMLVPESIGGQLFHSKASIQHIASGKKVQISSDEAIGPNHVHIQQDIVAKTSRVDTQKLKEKFGLAIGEKGEVRVVEAIKGLVLEVEKLDNIKAEAKEPVEQEAEENPSEKKESPISREEKRQDLLDRMKQKRGKEMEKRQEIRERLAKGDTLLISEPFFEEEEKELATPVITPMPVLEPKMAKDPEIKKEKPQPMFTGKMGKAFILESLEELGFDEERLGAYSEELDYSDVGLALDEEVLEALFLDEEKGSGLYTEIAAQEGEGKSSDKKDKDAEDSHLGEDGSYLESFARYYVDKATDRIEKIPGQEGVDPVAKITERTREEFSRYFKDSLARYNLGSDYTEQQLAFIQEDMWREFNHFFLPYFISEYKKVLDGVRDDDRFFKVGNPLDKIALIEQGFLKDMAAQVDVFSNDFFPSAFNFYTETFDRERYVRPELDPTRGEDIVYIGRDYADFPSFNYAPSEIRKEIDNAIDQDSGKFVGFYTNTREAPNRSSLPFIKALSDLTAFQKEGDNPFVEDDFKTLIDSLKAVKNKVEDLEDNLNGDWTNIDSQDLKDMETLVADTLEKTQVSIDRLPAADNPHKAALSDLKEKTLAPLLAKLDRTTYLYIGLSEEEKNDLSQRLENAEKRMEKIRAFVKENVIVKEGGLPPELKFDNLQNLEEDIRLFEGELKALEAKLHPDDPTIDVTKDFLLYTQLEKMVEDINALEISTIQNESLPQDKVFEGLSLADQLLKMTDSLEGHQVDFANLQNSINITFEEANGVDSFQTQIQLDLLSFLEGEYKQITQLGGVIDQAILDLQQGEAFTLPKEAIIDLDLAAFREEANQLKEMIRVLDDDNFYITTSNQKDLLQLSKSFLNFKQRYNYLDSSLDSDHPLKIAELTAEGVNSLWDEMGLLIANIDNRLSIFVRGANDIPVDDPELLNLRAYFIALDSVVIHKMFDEKEGKSLIDRVAGGGLKNEGLQAAGVKKGELSVINKISRYIEDGMEKRSREVAYVGKALDSSQKSGLSGVKKFNSQLDEYHKLPDLMTSILAYAGDDNESEVFETDAVIDFGADGDKPKGFINFFSPLSFIQQAQEGELEQQLPELQFENSITESQVQVVEPVVSPSIFSGYEVKSVLVDQDKHTYIEEGDVIMVLGKDVSPPGTFLDMKALLTQEALGLSDEVAALGFEGYRLESYLADNNTTVNKGDSIITLVRSNEDIPVEISEQRLETIPEGYKIKSLNVPQNEATLVQEGNVIMWLEHEDPQKRGFFKDIAIRASQPGSFVGQQLAVGDEVAADLKVGEITGIENLGESRIILAAEESGVLTHTLEVGEFVNPGDKVARITHGQELVFEDIKIIAQQSGIYKGNNLQVGDSVDTLNVLGEFIADTSGTLETDFLQEKVPQQLMLFGKERQAAAYQSNPQAAMVYYFDDEQGDKELFQLRGFLPEKDENENIVKTPLKRDISSTLITDELQVIGSEDSSGNITVDGLALTGNALGTDAQLVSTSFHNNDQDLLLPSGDGNGNIPQNEYYGFASGFLVNVNEVDNTMDSWSVSASKNLYLPLAFEADGQGSYFAEGQLQLQTGVDYRFGQDADQANMVVDREHILTSFDSINGKGLLTTFALPEFIQKDFNKAIISQKPHNVIWGAWDIEANTNLPNTKAVLPGMHNYFVAATPTSSSEYTNEVANMLGVNLPVSSYQLMLTKSMIASEDLSDDAKAASTAGFGDLRVDFSDDTWASMVYFADGSLLVGRGNQDSFSIKNTSDIGVDVQGFNTENGGWTLVDLMGRPEAFDSNLYGPSLDRQGDDALGVGAVKGFYAGDQMTEVVLTGSAQDVANGDAVSLVGVGGFSGFEFTDQRKDFVGFIEGVREDESLAEPESKLTFLNLKSLGLSPTSQNLELSSLTQDQQELEALLQANPYIDPQSVSSGDASTYEKHSWVEVRENFKTLAYNGIVADTISQRIFDGSAVTIGDTLLSAESGLEIMSTIDGTVFFHDGQVPGASLVEDQAFATIVAYEGEEVLDGISTRFSRFTTQQQGGVEKGFLTLSTKANEDNPLGLPNPNNDIQDQGRVIIKTATPQLQHIPELTVEYRVKVDDLVATQTKNDRPFYVRLLLAAPDGREFVVELPKLDISGVDAEGYVDYLFDSASTLSGDVAIYDTAQSQSTYTINVADFLADGASDADLKAVLNEGLITEVSLIFGGDAEVSGELHIDHITIGNEGRDEFALSDDFENLISTPEELIFLNKDAFYITPTSVEEARLYLPSIEGMDPVAGSGFIATLKGLEDFEYLSFGLWRSQYENTSTYEREEVHGFFAVGDANHLYTRSDHERYLEALRQFNLPKDMQYKGLSIGSVYGPNRDGRVQVGEALLNINMLTGATSGKIQLGADVIDLQAGTLQELRQAMGGGNFSNGMGFSGSAELRINGAAASGRTDLGTYQGGLYGRYNSTAIDAAQEAAGSFKSRNASGTHRASGAFGVKKN